MTCKYKAVFFDFDGTIANTSRGIFECLDYACDCLKIERPSAEIKRLFVGPPLFQSFTELMGCTEEETNFAISKYREMYRGGGMLKLDLYDGIEELLVKLKTDNIIVAICSSKPKEFVNKIITNLGIADKIDFVSCPNTDNSEKPKKELIGDALTYFGLDSTEAVMIGDTKFDIEGAKACNVESIGAAYGFGGKDELIDSGADYIAESVNEILKFLYV